MVPQTFLIYLRVPRTFLGGSKGSAKSKRLRNTAVSNVIIKCGVLPTPFMPVKRTGENEFQRTLGTGVLNWVRLKTRGPRVLSCNLD